MEFDPFNDYRIITAGEDCRVKLWQIPEDNFTANLDTPIWSFTMSSTVNHVRKSAYSISMSGFHTFIVCANNEN
jgi:hypothetical protein